jgi:hypothetical protein
MSAPSKSLEKEFKHQLRHLLDQCPYFFYLRDDDFDSMSEGITKGTKTITNIFRAFVVERAMIRSSSLPLLKQYYLYNNKSGCLYLTNLSAAKRRTNEREHLLKVVFDVPDFFKMSAVISMPKGVSTAEILSFNFFTKKKATNSRREKKNVHLTRAQLFNVIETSLLSKPQWQTMTRERVSHSVHALMSQLKTMTRERQNGCICVKWNVLPVTCVYGLGS